MRKRIRLTWVSAHRREIPASGGGRGSPALPLRGHRRATRWGGVAYLSGAGRGQCKRVVSRDQERATLMKIARVLMDNGKAIADRLSGLRKCSPAGRHEFDLLCADLGIEHRLAPPMRLQKNPRTGGADHASTSSASTAPSSTSSSISSCARTSTAASKRCRPISMQRPSIATPDARIPAVAAWPRAR